MNNPLPTLMAGRVRRRTLAVASLLLLLPLQSKCWATSIFSFTMQTVGLSGQGLLGFDLIDGNGTYNSTALVTNLLVPGGSLLNGGNGTVVINETVFFNEATQLVTFGTSLSFTLSLTQGSTGGNPDQFSFFLLNQATPISFSGINTFAILPGFTSNAPGGSQAVFVIDFGGGATTYNSTTNNVSWTLLSAPAVPERGSTLLLLGASLGVLGLIHLVRTTRRRR